MSSVEMNRARHWEFLFPWFETLRLRLRAHFDPRHDRISSHPVRVGLDVNDWWIFVDVTDDGLDDYETTVQRIREALLMVTAFARINRVCCWQFLQIVALFERAAWMDLDDPAFYPRFVIDVAKRKQGDGAAKMKTLKTAIDGLLAAAQDNYSEEFLKDWARVLAMCERIGWQLAQREPLALRFVVDLHSVDEDNHIEYCYKITEGVERVNPSAVAPGGLRGVKQLAALPRFQVAAMDLYLGELSWSVDIIQALQQLTDLDIPLHTVELPDFEPFVIGQVSTEWRLAWCNLLRSLTGQLDQPREKSEAYCHRRVRRLVVPREYTTQEPLRSSLFSAMVDARGVEELEIKMAQSLERAAEISFWAWVASVVFRERETSGAIETLTISGVMLSMTAMETLTRDQPLLSLAGVIAPQFIQATDSKSLQKRVKIAAGTELEVFEGGEMTSRIQTQSELDATVLCESANEQEHLLLVPGFGVCSTAQVDQPRSGGEDHDMLTPKYQCVLVNLRLEQITTHHHEEYLVSQFMKAMGGERLRGLYIDFPLPERTLVRTLTLCPNLEALSIACVSFDTLLNAYARGTKIRSLHLLNLGIRTLSEATRFLDELKSSETAAANTVERLCMSVVGVIVREETWPMGRNTPMSVSANFHQNIVQVLRENQVLTHLWCLSGRSQSIVNWAVERNHGKQLVKPRNPLKPKVVLAFLHALHRKSEAGNRYESVPDAVKAHILSFAAESQRRSVLCEDPFTTTSITSASYPA